MLHFSQMGEIRAILFLLPHAPSTLANCYRICAVCATNCYRMRSVRQQFATVCAVCAYKADHMLILPIYLNQVLTNEKSEQSEKNYFNTFNWTSLESETTFFQVLTQSQKSLLTVKKTGRKFNRCLEFLSHRQLFPSVQYKNCARHHCLFCKSHRQEKKTLTLLMETNPIPRSRKYFRCTC